MWPQSSQSHIPVCLSHIVCVHLCIISRSMCNFSVLLIKSGEDRKSAIIQSTLICKLLIQDFRYFGIVWKTLVLSYVKNPIKPKHVSMQKKIINANQFFPYFCPKLLNLLRAVAIDVLNLYSNENKNRKGKSIFLLKSSFEHVAHLPSRFHISLPNTLCVSACASSTSKFSLLLLNH